MFSLRSTFSLLAAMVLAGLSLLPIAALAAGDEPTDEQMRINRLHRVWSDFNRKQNEGKPPHLTTQRTGNVIAWPADFPKKLNVPVTIHFAGTSEDALAELTRQTGVKIITRPAALLRGGGADVKLDADSHPLLDVLLQLCGPAGLSVASSIPNIAPPTTQPLIIFQDLPTRTIGPWCACGPFAFEIQRIVATSDLSVDLHGPQVLQLTVHCMAEPGVKPLQVPVKFDVDQAVDELGHSLIAPSNQGFNHFFNGMSIDLNVPPGAGHTIARLRARYHCVIQSSSESIALDELPLREAVTKSAAGMDITIGPVVLSANDECTVPIKFSRGQRSAIDWAKLRVALNNVAPEVFDADGGVIRYERANPQGSSDEMVSVVHSYTSRSQMGAKQGTPARLTLAVPTDVYILDVPVQFDDLPLP